MPGYDVEKNELSKNQAPQLSQRLANLLTETMSIVRDLNPRPAEYKSAALTMRKNRDGRNQLL
jgi:hypothetical protein